MPESEGSASINPEELQRALLLLSTMVKSGGPGKSPVDEYLEEEKRRQEQEKNRQAKSYPQQNFSQYGGGGGGGGGQGSGFQQMLGNLGTANTASQGLTGNSLMDWMGQLFSSGSGSGAGAAAAK